MLGSNLSLLLLFPLAIILFGVVRLVKGIYQNQFQTFRASFFLFLVGFLGTTFLVFVGKNSTTATGFDSDLVTVFLFSSFGLSIGSLFGVMFYSFNGFVPTFFTRLNLFLAVFSVLIGVAVSVKAHRAATEAATLPAAGKMIEVDSFNADSKPKDTNTNRGKN